MGGPPSAVLPYDVRFRVDRHGLGVRGARNVEQSELAVLASQEAVARSAGAIRSHDVAARIDRRCVRTRGTGDINRSELAVACPQKAVVFPSNGVNPYGITFVPKGFPTSGVAIFDINEPEWRKLRWGDGALTPFFV